MEKNLRNRNTLKEYFRKGNVPTAEHFAELIDSVPNILEDNLHKPDNEGFRFSAKNGEDNFAVIYDSAPDSPDEVPYWLLRLDDKGGLEIRNKEREALLLIGQDNVVTINGNLQVKEHVYADSFCGTAGMEDNETGYLSVPADGTWHDLPVEAAANQESKGCHIYKIYASYKNNKNNSYEMIEAIASHRNTKKKKITSPNKRRWGWSGKIKFRWMHRNNKLFLQMKSKGKKKYVEAIYYRISELWSFTDTL
jgi:hypothetical protein